MAETTSITDADLTRRADTARKCLNALRRNPPVQKPAPATRLVHNNVGGQDGDGDGVGDGLNTSQASVQQQQRKTSPSKRKFKQESTVESLSRVNSSIPNQHRHAQQQSAKRRCPAPTQENSCRSRPRIKQEIIEIPDSNQSSSGILSLVDPDSETGGTSQSHPESSQIQSPKHIIPPFSSSKDDESREARESHQPTDHSSGIPPAPPRSRSLSIFGGSTGSHTLPTFEKVDEMSSSSSDSTHGHTPSFLEFDAMPSDCDGCCLHKDDCSECCLHSSIDSGSEGSQPSPGIVKSQLTSQTPVRHAQSPIEPFLPLPPPLPPPPDPEDRRVVSSRNRDDSKTGTRSSDHLNRDISYDDHVKTQIRLNRLERKLKSLTEALRQKYASDQKSLEVLLRTLESCDGSGDEDEDEDLGFRGKKTGF